MSFWKNLFGGTPKPARAASQEEKDVEALCIAAVNAIDFITRHNLPGMSGDAVVYRNLVANAFRIAAEKILPAKDVAAMFMSTIRIIEKRKYVFWSDDEMRSVFPLQLDQAMALIGHTPEVLPLALLKADLQKSGL